MRHVYGPRCSTTPGVENTIDLWPVSFRTKPVDPVFVGKQTATRMCLFLKTQTIKIKWYFYNRMHKILHHCRMNKIKCNEVYLPVCVDYTINISGRITKDVSDFRCL